MPSKPPAPQAAPEPSLQLNYGFFAAKSQGGPGQEGSPTSRYRRREPRMLVEATQTFPLLNRSERRIGKRERESHVDKRGVDGADRNC